MIDLQTSAQAIGAQATGEARFNAVLTDSRALRAGCLFVALRGERFDGHDFLDAARQAGAVAAMVDRAWADAHPAGGDLPWLVVDDTRDGLGALAAWWRTQFDIPLIGVTGSNGKTTVKEMCAAIASAWVARAGGDPAAAVLATAGNFNNDIGLPLTLLRLRAEHRVAIIEMGMNHPGEIAYLSGLAAPTVAVISNALRAHLAGVGDLDGVAREKGAIYGAANRIELIAWDIATHFNENIKKLACACRRRFHHAASLRTRASPKHRLPGIRPTFVSLPSCARPPAAMPWRRWITAFTKNKSASW